MPQSYKFIIFLLWCDITVLTPPSPSCRNICRITEKCREFCFVQHGLPGVGTVGKDDQPFIELPLACKTDIRAFIPYERNGFGQRIFGIVLNNWSGRQIAGFSRSLNGRIRTMLALIVSYLSQLPRNTRNPISRRVEVSNVLEPPQHIEQLVCVFPCLTSLFSKADCLASFFLTLIAWWLKITNLIISQLI